MEERMNRFPYLEISPEKREVRYMGYVLPLTQGEQVVLWAVLCSDGFADKQDIKNIIDADMSTDAKVSVESVPVHVFSINRKAKTANGRKIVEFRRNKGYFINKDM